jgi:hypothetical protein
MRRRELRILAHSFLIIRIVHGLFPEIKWVIRIVGERDIYWVQFTRHLASGGTTKTKGYEVPSARLDGHHSTVPFEMTDDDDDLGQRGS